MNIYIKLKELYHKYYLLKKSSKYSINEIKAVEEEIIKLENLIDSVNYYLINDMALIILQYIRLYERKECFYIRQGYDYCIKDYDNNVLFNLIHKEEDNNYCDIYNIININNKNANGIFEFIDYLYNIRINYNYHHITMGEMRLFLEDYVDNRKKKYTLSKQI